MIKNGSKEEKEVKVQISSGMVDDLITRIKKFALHSGQITQDDIYYDTLQLTITNLNRGLRIRNDATNRTVLEFKSLFYDVQSKDNPWYIEEVTLPFPLSFNSIKILNNILFRLGIKKSFEPTKLLSISDFNSKAAVIGLTPQIIVTKKRDTYVGTNNIHRFYLDFVENLGYFLEVESEQFDLESILESLFPEKSYQIIRNGYNDMIASTHPSYIPNEYKQRLFSINPEWNILAGEFKYVRKLFKNRI